MYAWQSSNGHDGIGAVECPSPIQVPCIARRIFFIDSINNSKLLVTGNCPIVVGSCCCLHPVLSIHHHRITNLCIRQSCRTNVEPTRPPSHPHYHFWSTTSLSLACYSNLRFFFSCDPISISASFSRLQKCCGYTHFQPPTVQYRKRSPWYLSLLVLSEKPFFMIGI